MIIGIVGCEAAKFTPETEEQARLYIRSQYARPEVTGFSSGHCHLGGVDIYAEQEAPTSSHIFERYIYPANVLCWKGTKVQDGFMERNIKIAEKSDEVHVITLKELPPTYTGMRFTMCYHCKTSQHVKSGGCWTARYAMKLGKKAVWYVI